MDVNAGAYLDGTSMDELTAQTFDLSIEVASGRRTKGERAGHSQVSIWRDWRQTGPDHWRAITTAEAPDGRPIVLPGVAADQTSTVALERVGLVMPTSLCAGQIARMAAERLNASGLGRRCGISRFVSLTHSEGCGFAGDRFQEQLLRTYVAYGTHPLVAATLFLEHGCERTPNDLVKRELTNEGFDSAAFGWASIQLDGGIDRVLAKIDNWFESRLERNPVVSAASPLAVGIVSEGEVSPLQIDALVQTIRTIVSSGGSVLIPESDGLLANETFRSELTGNAEIHPTLGPAQRLEKQGFHVVATESSHWLENVSGLGASGAQVIAAAGDNATQPNHPLLSVIRLQDETDARSPAGLLMEAASGRAPTAANATGESAFQITRGLLGVSA
jgi:altronate dehydratase